MDTKITYVDISELHPHEAAKEKKLSTFSRFAGRVRKRLKLKPLWVDRHTKVILDGHHRYGMFRSLGFQRVPCILVDYLTDDSIQVLPRNPAIPVNKETVIAMGLSDRTFPPKTTKHVFPVAVPEIWVKVPSR